MLEKHLYTLHQIIPFLLTEIAENMLIVYLTNEWFVLITLLNEV